MDAATAFFIFTTGAAGVGLAMREIHWRQHVHDAVKVAVLDWQADWFRRIRHASNEDAQRAMEE